MKLITANATIALMADAAATMVNTGRLDAPMESVALEILRLAGRSHHRMTGKA